jgi:purine/pyrimidine-nucleoside phosphorylase
MATIPAQFDGVTATTKANVYFDGKVVSHSILFPDGSKKTLGLIYPGKFHFGTDKAELMEIVAGSCTVKIDGQTEVKTYAAGTAFEVPAKSGFDIEVASGIAEYICSFIG